MNKILCAILVALSSIAYASDTKPTVESAIPEAPEAPKIESTSKETKRTLETKKREEKKEKEEKRTVPMHDVMIFLDAGDEPEYGGPITSDFASALCQQSFPIIVTQYVLNTFYKAYYSYKIIDSWKVAFNWNVYKTKSGDFYLFIPKKYLEKMSAEINEDALKKQIRSTKYNPDDVLLGFRTKYMVPIEKYDQIKPEKIEGKKDSKINIDSLKSIFVQGKDDFFGLWNVYLLGHGGFSMELVKQIQEGKFSTLKPLSVKDYADAHLAGLDLNQFRDLIDFFINNVNTNFFMYNTCFGGGVNTVLPYVTTIMNQKGNVTSAKKPNFTLVSGALTDVYTFGEGIKEWCVNCLGEKNFEECLANGQKKGARNEALFFEKLHEHAKKNEARPTLYNNTQLEEIFKAVVYRHSISKSVYDPYGITGLPLILFPHTDAFVAFDLGGKIGIISPVLLKKHVLEKKQITFKNKEAILVYPSVISVPVIIETATDTPSSIVSMIPGLALHRFESIAINTTMPLFVRSFGGGVYEKYYYIKKLQVLADKKEKTVFYNVFIKAYIGNVNVLCMNSDKSIVYHYISNAGVVRYDISGFAISEKLNIEVAEIGADDFLNALFTYFGSESPVHKENQQTFSYKTIIAQLLTNNEKSVLEKSYKQLVENKTGKLLQEFPDLYTKPDAINKAGQTPLLEAVKNGDLDVVKAIINLGAKINAHNKDGQTPLMAAVEHNKPKIVKYLMGQNKINIFAEDAKGNSALRSAIAAKNNELVTLIVSPLLEKYSTEFPHILTSPNELSSSGESPLNRAVRDVDEDHGNAYKALIQMGASINQIDKKGKAPFVEIAKQYVIDRDVKYFLEHGANINFQDADGVTALMAVGENTSRHRVEDAITYLVDHGANVALKDKNGKTAFDYMPNRKNEWETDLKFLLLDLALKQKKESAELLHELFGYLAKEFPGFEKKPNALNDAGQAPLHVAIKAGDFMAVMALAKLGADLTMADKNGNTPLMLAVENEKKEIVQWLAEQKTILDTALTENKQGQSALSIAKAKKYNEIIERLVKPYMNTYDLNDKIADPNKSVSYPRQSYLNDAIETKDLNKIKIMVQLGANVNLVDEEGGAPLAQAVKTGKKDIVAYLLAKGADINGAGAYTPLMVALNGYPDIDMNMVTYLLENGADINKPDRSGGTVLKDALIYGKTKLVRYLLEKGADVITDSKTLLRYANREEIKEMLEKAIKEQSEKSK